MYCTILLGNPAKPDHTFRSTKELVSCSISLDYDEFGSSIDFAVADINRVLASKFFKFIYDQDGLEPPVVRSNYQRISASEETAVASVNQSIDTQSETINPNVPAGQQISVEMGLEGVPLLKYVFINDSLGYDFNSRIMTFGGSVASKMMTEVAKNTAYSDITFENLAKQIADQYGLIAVFDPLKNNPTYEFIPQYGISDYQFLLLEAKRLGYRVTNKGRELKFYGTEIKEDKVFRLTYRDNLISCDFAYQTDPVGSENVRESVGADGSTYGVKKWDISDSGVMVPIRSEVETTDASKFTTGSKVAELKPATEDTIDQAAVENTKRAKGLVMNFATPFDPLSAKLDPQTGIIVDGVSDTLDRVFIPEKITIAYKNGAGYVSGSAYSPLKPKYKEIQPPSPDVDLSQPGDLPGEFSSAVAGDGSVNARLMATYRRLGNFETRSVASRYGISPNVACVAAMNHIFIQSGLTPIWGSTLAVVVARNALRSAGLRPIPRAQVLPGDIHIVSIDFRRSHIGLALNSSQVVSNSSSRARFSWISPPGFPPTYSGSPINEFYRDNRRV